eukprot:CAMPEP_0117524414 /NCGR_PEP_ID=MMETSP0784-20121206/35233_1 /TAXON_ID=39447 /ORGANISM="" /LENGTH=45 /DNA_ID= /DNA_START= /DNA_END= /DNA_ORIENTATION=
MDAAFKESRTSSVYATSLSCMAILCGPGWQGKLGGVAKGTNAWFD